MKPGSLRSGPLRVFQGLLITELFKGQVVCNHSVYGSAQMIRSRIAYLSGSDTPDQFPCVCIDYMGHRAGGQRIPCSFTAPSKAPAS